MDAVLSEFGLAAEAVQIGSHKCTYVSGTLAQTMEEVEFDSHYWQRHLRDSVRFSEAFRLVWNECKILIEIGATPILLGLAMSNVEDQSSGVFCPSIRRNEEPNVSIHTAMKKLYVAGVDFNWSAIYGIRQKCVQLPLYPFQRERYWYVEDTINEDQVSPLLHPLLGRRFHSPLPEILFSQTYKLNELDYLEDHKVADQVIVPAAAFLENFLAAGREIMYRGATNRFPLTIENLTVEAALQLDNKCQIQTVARSQLKKEAKVHFNITINRNPEHNLEKWKKHASASFVPNSELTPNPVFEIDSFKQSNIRESTKHNYEAIAEVGIQLGPRFQSLTSVWYGQNTILASITLPEDHLDYVCHPIVLDAMIQAFAFRERWSQSSESNLKKSLHLPVGIRRFTWLSREYCSTSLYALCDIQSGNIRLLTESGLELAVMEGVELLETSPSALVRAIRADSVEIPDLMTDVWREVVGKTTSRIDTRKLVILDDQLSYEDPRHESGSLQKALEETNSSPFYCFLIAIQECGWPWPAVNESMNTSIWKSKLPASLDPRIIGIWTNELESRGFLFRLDTESFLVLKALPSIQELDYLLTSNKHPFIVSEKKLCDRYRSCLPLILQDRMLPLTFLFPENEPGQGAVDYYSNSQLFNHANRLICAQFNETVVKFKNSSEKNGILRILEVGAGSGCSTRLMLEGLRAANINFQYTFTDVSQFFLNDAKKKFEAYPEVSYKILNLEQDPLTQGFSPEEFDIVIGVQVVHATRDIKESLTNIKKILSVGGLLILGEGFEPHAFLVFLFGMTDGWWRFNDSRLNNSRMTALADQDQWTSFLTSVGYDSIGLNPGIFFGAVSARNSSAYTADICVICNRKQWLIASDDNTDSIDVAIAKKFRQYDRDVVHDISEVTDDNLEGVLYLCTNGASEDVVEDQRKIASKLLHLLKWCEKYPELHKTRPRIVVVTRGVYSINDSEPGNPNGATAWGMLKVFRNENTAFNICLIDLAEVPTSNEIDQVFAQLWNQDDEFFVAFREKQTLVLRLTYFKKSPLSLPLPQTDRFELMETESGTLTEAQFGPATKVIASGVNVEVQIRAAALNNKNRNFFNISGIVTSIGTNTTLLQIGDEVLGCTEKGVLLGSHTIISEKLLIKLPSNMTFVEACTIPYAFFGSYEALMAANLSATDKILISDATSGIGLAAIQVAKLVGAKIFVTARTKKQRAYLGMLGIKHVDSLDDHIKFVESIRRHTDGTGISVVFNSVEDPILNAAILKACSFEARFIQVGDAGDWKPEVLRPDVLYTVLNNCVSNESFRMVDKYLHAGTFSALPSTTFPLSQLPEAFSYLQKYIHIGEIVVQLPYCTWLQSGTLEYQHQVFNDKSTYLITGGLGGIGIEVAKWMRSKGAKTIVLVGRNSARSHVQNLIEDWNQSGSNIITLEADIGSYEACKGILEKIKTLNLPPLRGIMHAAGVLADNNIERQTLEDIEYVLKPKVYGGWSLHKLTLDYNMEFFVMFSSVSGLFGLPGQCNHVAANRYLDSLAFLRKSMGLPANTINWGAWSDIGAAAGLATSSETFVGFRIFTPSQGIAALERIMTSLETQIGVSEVSDWNVIDNILRQGKYLDEMRSANTEKTSRLEKCDNLFDAVKQAGSSEDRHEKLRVYIDAIMKQTLGLPENQVLDIDQNVAELGVDSLMAMEMKNKFQSIVGDRPVTSSGLQANRTIRTLTAYLSQVMDGEAVDPAVLAAGKDHFIY